MKRQRGTRKDAWMKPMPVVGNRELLGHQHSFGSTACVQRAGTHERTSANSAPVGDVLSSPGRPLDKQTQAIMEPQFGRDFSDVRVHTEETAGTSAREIGAKAYTVHNHIAFAPGRYDPHSESGNRLLAHELTHVVQQGPVSSNPLHSPSELPVVASLDASEQIAEQVASGRMDARQAGPRTVAAPVIQREPDNKNAPAPKKANALPNKAVQTPAAPAERQFSPDEAWLFAENRIVTELETRYEELVRFGAYQTRDQIKNFFDPYTDDLEADSTFNTIIGIAGGSAGNIPNDPSSIQPLSPDQSPKTPHGPVPPTFSVSGGIAGGLAAAIAPLIGVILDTSKVGEIKKNLQTDVDKFLAQNLTTSSDTYGDFENIAKSEMQQYFLSNWTTTDRPHTAADLSSLINETAHHARASYGLESSVGQKVTEAIRDYVAQQLAKLQPVLDGLEQRHRRKRYLGFGLGAGIVGGLVGGALGFGLGGGTGLAIGAGIGLLGGGLLGVGAAGLTNLLTDSAQDKRSKAAAEKAKEEEKKRKNDMLEPRFRPKPTTANV